MNSPDDALDLVTLREAQSCAPERAGILGFTAPLKTHDGRTVGAMYTPLPSFPPPPPQSVVYNGCTALLSA